MAKNPETKVKFSVFNKEFNDGLKEMGKQSSSLRKEFKLQEEQLKENGTQTEKYEVKLDHLKKQHTLAEQKVKATAEQLAKAKTVYGENSDEVRKLSDQLLGFQTNQQKLANQINATTKEQDQYKKSLTDLGKLFNTTNTKVDDFAEALGPDLVSSIKKGTASTKQLEKAFNKVSQEALGSRTDIQKVKKALSELDDGQSIKSVRKDLGKLAKKADDTKGSIKDLGSEIGGLAGGLAAGGGIAGATGLALDADALRTRIAITFDVSEESKQTVFETVRSIETYGVDAGAALEGVRRQWALNKDATEEANLAVVKGAAVVASSYEGLDFTELIQETNEIGSALNISNEEAVGLVQSLLKTGFPPDQIDIVSEYGTQLSLAGYSAEEIQNIFAAGVDTKSWNIDNLMDGLKEGRVKLAEFGNEVPKALAEVIEGTDISEQKIKGWGQAVAEGGQKGKTAMFEAAKALAGVEDSTKRNEIGVQMFGTMWEDQGSKIVDTLLNAKNGTANLKQGMEGVNEATAKLDASPTVQLKQALQNLKTSLTPLLVTISNFITKIATWVSQNPKLAATITAVVTVLGILVGLCMALAPVLTILSGLAAALGIGLLPLIGIIAGVIAVIAGLIAAGIAIWKNWDTIKAKASQLGSFLSSKFNETKDRVSGKISEMKQKATQNIEQMKSSIQQKAESIRSGVQNKIQSLKDGVTNRIQSMKDRTLGAVENLRSGFSNKVQSLKDGVQNRIQGMKDRTLGTIENLRSGFSSKVESIRSTVSSKFESAKNAIISPIETAKSRVLGMIETIKGAFSRMRISIPKFKIPSIGVRVAWGGPGDKIPYPKFSVNWHKIGGVFKKPVVAGNAGFGDVEEGIVPFEGSHAMKIAKLIAAAQTKLKNASEGLVDKANESIIYVNVSPANVVMDSKKVGKVIWKPVKAETNNNRNLGRRGL
ncbi:replication protein [Pseudalkalibacillus caeni]|uniref:Replication protein n=1 Tax=Exobacillus caeni TaxID=2574798 RepID=A0A5R9F5X4_9BACL|nr:replication protein [Pseudalkalibacillus caeni]TLS37736.1 replication protein [Pseudalkalibacillus caeni]